MTKLLEEFIAQVAQLPAAEQDAFAQWARTELAAESRWQQLFDQSSDMLARLADQALIEHRAERTQPLDLDRP